MSDSTDRRADRYGGPIVAPRTAKILVAAVAAAFLAVVGYVGLQVTDQPITSQLVSYEHVDTDLIGVSFTVSMRPGTEATCEIQALNEGRAQVGFVEMPIPAQSQRQSMHEVEISTQGDAVSAEILGCEKV